MVNPVVKKIIDAWILGMHGHLLRTFISTEYSEEQADQLPNHDWTSPTYVIDGIEWAWNTGMSDFLSRLSLFLRRDPAQVYVDALKQLLDTNRWSDDILLRELYSRVFSQLTAQKVEQITIKHGISFAPHLQGTSYANGLWYFLYYPLSGNRNGISVRMILADHVDWKV